MQLVLHAPFGGRINRAWGMALRKRFCRTFDFELQAAATDDGIVLSLGPQHSFPLETVFEMLRARATLEELLTQAALQAPMFETRWRWNATRVARAAALPGRQARPAAAPAHARGGSAGRGVPGADRLPGQPRRRAPIEIPDHPLVRETMRDCLIEAMDADGPARRARARSRAAQIRRVARETPEPSRVLARDPERQPVRLPRRRAARGAPRARGRACAAGCPPRSSSASAASIRRRSPRWSPRRSPTRATPTSCTICCSTWARCPEADRPTTRGWTRRSSRRWSRPARGAAAPTASRVLWVAAERRSLAAAVWPDARFAPDVVEPPARRARRLDRRESALVEIVRARLAPRRPDHRAGARARPGLHARPTSDARSRASRWRAPCCAAASRRRGSGDGPTAVVRSAPARAHPPPHARRPAPRDRAGRPRPTHALPLRWQHVRRAASSHGRDGLARVIEQLQGFEAAAGAWEREILPARVAATTRRGSTSSASRARSAGAGSRRATRGAARRAAPRRSRSCGARDLAWLLARPTRERPADDEALSPPARDVLAFLRARRRQLPRRDRRGRAPPARRGRGRALGAGRRGPRHRRRLRGPARADLADADARRRARALARALGRRAGARRSAPAAGRCSRRAAARRRRAERRLATRRTARAPVPHAATAWCSAICSRASRRRRRGAICCASTAASRCAASCAAAASWRGFVGEQFARPRRVEALRAIRARADGAARSSGSPRAIR